jgi:CRP-like cAMP-binding protein
MSSFDAIGSLASPCALPAAPALRDQRLRQWSRAVGCRLRLPAGAVAVRQGDLPREVVLLESGRAVLRRAERSGLDVAIGLCDGGAFLGLASAIHQRPHAASAVLRTGGEIVAVPTACFIEALASPHLGPAIVEQLAREHVELIERYAARAALSVRDRVLAVLRDAAPAHAGLPAKVPLSTTDLASLAGADSSSVCRTLRELHAEGLVSFGRRRLAVRVRLA